MKSLLRRLSAVATTQDAIYKNPFRSERMRRFMLVVDEVLASKDHCSIIDVGGTVSYWLAKEEMWGHKNISILIVNLAVSEAAHPKITQMYGNACDLSSFPDSAFDLAHSNSVIEHVGRWTDKKNMAKEIRRVAQRYFVQTPSMSFPIEPHYRAPFIHWLPPQLRAWLLIRFSMGFYEKAATFDEARETVEDAELLSLAEMHALFPDAITERERFFGMTKSLVAIR